MSETQLDRLLDGDEKVLWSGGPSSERLLMRNDYWLIPGGVLLGIVGLAGLLVTSAQLLAGENSWPQFGGSLVALWFGWQGVIGHTIHRRRMALLTSYVLTDRRVLELRTGDEEPKIVREASLGEATELSVRPQYEGRATIKVDEVALFNIPGAIRVESLIRQQLPAKKSGDSGGGGKTQG